METVPDLLFVLTILMTEDRVVVVSGLALFVAYMVVKECLRPDAEGEDRVVWWNSSPAVYT